MTLVTVINSITHPSDVFLDTVHINVQQSTLYSKFKCDVFDTFVGDRIVAISSGAYSDITFFGENELRKTKPFVGAEKQLTLNMTSNNSLLYFVIDDSEIVFVLVEYETVGDVIKSIQKYIACDNVMFKYNNSCVTSKTDDKATLLYELELPSNKLIVVLPIIVDDPRSVPVKKKAIPKRLKSEVWDVYIGEDVGSALCLCCHKTKITQSNFHCGHIVAETNGGKTNINNLKPICAQCNLSMGTKNMNDFSQLFC